MRKSQSLEEKITQLQQIVQTSDNIVFFGGAGVSTESGIPDFRSENGLYRKKYDFPPETILSHTFFVKHTDEFYRFYRDKMLCLDAKPNTAHTVAAALEACGKLKAVVTQNIVGLHQAAGSKTVYELHGSIHRNYCMKCGAFYSTEAIADSEGVPVCTCGGIIKPDVVLYEESLDNDTIEKSVAAISRAEVLIVGGTSLSVYPAAGLIRYYHGSRLVLINQSPTQYDASADLLINSSLGQVLGSLVL